MGSRFGCSEWEVVGCGKEGEEGCVGGLVDELEGIKVGKSGFF